MGETGQSPPPHPLLLQARSWGSHSRVPEWEWEEAAPEKPLQEEVEKRGGARAPGEEEELRGH